MTETSGWRTGLRFEHHVGPFAGLCPQRTHKAADSFLWVDANKPDGMGAMSKGQKEAMQDNHDRYRTIMDSMTAWEENEPAKIKADRIKRIARGSGVRKKDVRERIGQWNRSRKMMKGMGGNRKLNKQMRKMMKEGDMDIDPFSFGM